MIDDVLSLLREKLNGYFKYKAEASYDIVSFLEGTVNDTVFFPADKVVPVLINIEEDKTLRQADLFEGKIRNGIKTQINPTLCINLLVLFVCKFVDYKQSLKFLSLIIRFFQRNQVLDGFNSPDLPPEIDQLKIELVTLPVAQQNEIWSSLRTAYIPSVLYKISMLVFEDNDSYELSNRIEEIKTNLSGI